MEIFDRYMESNQESSENEENENEVVEKVYQYMTKVLHLRVNHDEYIEWIENNQFYNLKIII